MGEAIVGREAVLYSYFRSSTSFRVRAALAFKGVAYAYEAIHLRRGEQGGERYRAVNPQGLVPTLIWQGGPPLAQSMAILEFLEETVPDPPLLPRDARGRARVRSLAGMIALDLHPVNNLRVLTYLRETFGADDDAVAAWFRHWVRSAFEPLEARLAAEPETGRFCHGDAPTIADLCVAGQVVNNARFDVDMGPYPTVQRIHEACLALDAVQAALPSRQPDAE